MFSGLDQVALQDIYHCLTPHQVRPGDILCRAQEAATSLFILQHGLAEVVLGAPDNDAAARPVARLRRGDVIGELALLTSEPRSATVVARLPTTVLELKRADFLTLLDRYPCILEKLARIIGHRMVQRNAIDRQGHRGEAVAVIAGRNATALAEQVVTATQAASPHLLQTCAISLPGVTAPSQAWLSVSALCGQLDALLLAHKLVLVSIGLEHDELPILLGEMDRVLLLGDASDARQLMARLDTNDPRVEVAVVGAEAAGMVPGSLAGFRVVRAVHPGCRGDVAWLGRHLSRTKLGLALGAGGAKGYAHIGVLQVLQAAGYTVDYVAGSSIGAWIGCWLAKGLSPAELETTLHTHFTPEAVEAMFRKGIHGTPSGVEVMTRLGQETTGACTFAELSLPLTVMTADLHTRRPAPLRTGPVWPTLVAAMTVPGLYPPYTCGEQQLMDAVSLVPVPTQAVVEAGADITMAVNLISRETLAAWPDAPPSPPLRGRGHDPVHDTLLEAIELVQLDASVRQAGLADVPVTPRFGPGTWRHFHLGEYFLAAGCAAAEAQLPALRALARPTAG
jgi:NTE family protein